MSSWGCIYGIVANVCIWGQRSWDAQVFERGMGPGSAVRSQMNSSEVGGFVGMWRVGGIVLVVRGGASCQ